MRKYLLNYKELFQFVDPPTVLMVGHVARTVRIVYVPEVYVANTAKQIYVIIIA